MIQTMTNRILHIDIAKGIGILLIVLGHNWIVLDNPGELYRIIYSVHIPLFLLLSGMFAKPESPFWVVARDRADSLLKPYFVTLTIVAVCLWWSTQESSVFTETIYSMLYGNADILAWRPLWFLPHLFLLSICASLLPGPGALKKIPPPGWGLILGSLLILGSEFARFFWPLSATWFSRDIQLKGLPFSADLLLLSGFYFLLGYLLRDQIINFKGSLPVALACAVIFLGIHLGFDYTVNLNMRRYEHPVLSTMQTLSGIYLILFTSVILTNQNFFSRILSHLGIHSMILLIFHLWIQTHAFELANTISQRKFYNGIGAFLATVLGCLILAELINRLPILRMLYRPIRNDRKILKPAGVAPDPS